MNALAIRAALAATILMTAAAPVRAAQPLQAALKGAMASRPAPAMAVLVIRNGVVADQAVRGVRASDSEEQARLDDAWHIGSDAKAMTATMIARLVERGVLSWTTPLKVLLPGVTMRRDYQDVTLVELLSHRAGLRDLDDTVDARLLAEAYVDRRPLPEQRQALARMVLNEAPIGPARAESIYSNSDYVLAGAIAEQATGKPFEVLMQEEVFHPLGITVAFAPSMRGQILGHKDGKPLSGLMADNPPLVAPTGAVRLTMQDWASFAIDQMAGERGQGKLLKAETYRFLHTPQGGTDAALGWGVRTTWPKAGPVRMLSHAGSNGYWNALIALLPDQNGGVLIAANSGEGEIEKVETAILLDQLTDIAAGR